MAWFAYLSGLTQWGFLQWSFLQWGHVFFFGLLFLYIFCFPQLPRDLEQWDFLWLRARGLRSSLDKSLSELTLYVDLVYTELVSLSIIAWR